MVAKSASRPPLTEDQRLRRYLAAIVNARGATARPAAEALARLDAREHGLERTPDWSGYLAKGASWLG